MLFLLFKMVCSRQGPHQTGVVEDSAVAASGLCMRYIKSVQCNFGIQFSLGSGPSDHNTNRYRISVEPHDLFSSIFSAKILVVAYAYHA